MTPAPRPTPRTMVAVTPISRKVGMGSGPPDLQVVDGGGGVGADVDHLPALAVEEHAVLPGGGAAQVGGQDEQAAVGRANGLAVDLAVAELVHHRLHRLGA